jgi:peptidylprolyl isomerase
MKKGEKRTLYIHPDLAYGMASHLPPNALLVFEVEIVEPQAPADALAEAEESTFEDELSLLDIEE